MPSLGSITLSSPYSPPRVLGAAAVTQDGAFVGALLELPRGAECDNVGHWGAGRANVRAWLACGQTRQCASSWANFSKKLSP